MGSKRGRLLIRQNRVKKECDGEDMGVTIPRVVERQCSEPGPSQSPTQPSPNLLTVPQATYLVKQHSSPLLPSPATVQVHLVTPPSETMPSIRVRTEELRRASSTPLVISCLNITFHSSPNLGFNLFYYCLFWTLACVAKYTKTSIIFWFCFVRFQVSRNIINFSTHYNLHISI